MYSDSNYHLDLVVFMSLTAQFDSPINDYLQHVQKQIRFAKEPDNPSLISHYLDIDTCRQKSVESLKQHYERQFRLLLDTVADELIPSHWRCCCLDNINKPLGQLARLFANNQDGQAYLCKLKYELNMTCHYVLSGLSR